MSDHKIPLTPLEESGLKKHGLPVGSPSQLSDAFRHGVKWAGSEIATLRQRVKDCEGAIQRREQMLEQAEARVAELEATLYHGNLERAKCQKAMILRKQAEAVEAASLCVLKYQVKSTLERYAQRLHQQADEAEKAND